MRGPLAAFLLCATCAAGQAASPARPPDEVLKAHIGNGAEIETRLDADLTGDGLPDTAYVGVGEGRILVVMAGVRGASGPGHRPIGETGLADGPLGPAQLSLRKGVLLVEDFTGGTTATVSTYRYRYDPKAGRMRLIGLDAERYSRTNAHPPLKISWNLLTGDHLTIRAREAPAGEDAAFAYEAPERTRRATAGPVWMEDTPAADGLIDAEVIAADEDRD